MNTKTLNVMTDVIRKEITGGRGWLGLGIAGNQAGHLGQAGEANDFKDVVAAENAPVGMFPWFTPTTESSVESFLQVNPLSSNKIKLRGREKVQPEPEIALIVHFSYAENGSVSAITVKGFSVFNDCSRRVEEPKISLKKNWGEESKGMPTEQIVAIDDFQTPGGTVDQYHLGCYLERGGQFIQYGEDTPVSNYCYLNETLTDWMIEQINTQEDAGPLESIATIVSETQPEYGVIAIGATCYTDFGNGEDRFLEAGDTLHVVAYDTSKYDQTTVEKLLSERFQPENVVENPGLLILTQAVED